MKRAVQVKKFAMFGAFVFVMALVVLGGAFAAEPDAGEATLFDAADAGEERDGEFVAVAYICKGFEGLAWKIREPGEYELGSGFVFPNDSISSVRVMPGYRVTLYEGSGLGGKSAGFEADTDDLGTWNRRASSLKVARVAEAGLDDVGAWIASVSEAQQSYAKLEINEAELAAYRKGEGAIRELNGIYADDWLGMADKEKAEACEKALALFRDCGLDTGDWTPASLARQLNNFYEWDQSELALTVACRVLNVDPDTFDWRNF